MSSITIEKHRETATDREAEVVKDPGKGTVVVIGFESEEKADKFRKEFYINGERTITSLRWDIYDDDAYALVWLAEDDE